MKLKLSKLLFHPLKDIQIKLRKWELNKLETTSQQTTWGTGGINTKLTAAKIATESGELPQ